MTTRGVTLPRQAVVEVPGWAIFAVCLVLALARYPLALLRAEFWADDAWLYTHALQGGSIFEPYAGYLLVGTRAVAWLAGLAPPPNAPAVSNLVALLILAAVASYAASSRMPWDRFSGALIAVGIVLLPMSFQLIGTMSHVQWPVALFMALTALAREPQSQLGRAAERVGLFVGGLTGPSALLTLPLFRGRRLLVVALAAAIQMAVIVVMGRGAEPGLDLGLVPEVLLLRAFVVPLAPIAHPVLTALVALSVAFLLGRSRLGWPLAYLIVVPALLGILALDGGTAKLLDVTVAPRYFWLAGAALVILLVTSRDRLLAWPLIGLLIFGVLTGFRIEVPTAYWSEQAYCIGVQPCRIVVQPGEPYAVESH